MNEHEFAEILARGRELRGVEHKGPGLRTSRSFRARVARAVMGMANLRDGGLVTIGVGDDDGKPVVEGLNAEQLESWERYDHVTASIGEFVQPSVSFEHEVFPYKGLKLVLLRVHEFDEIPILCARDCADEKGQPIVRRGALYVRPRRNTETAEVPTREEMREILDLAVEKGVRRFVALTSGLGFQVASEPEDDAHYERELEDWK